MAIYMCDACDSMKDGDHNPPSEIGNMDMVCEDCACEIHEFSDLGIQHYTTSTSLILGINFETNFDIVTQNLRDELEVSVKKTLVAMGFPSDGTGWTAHWENNLDLRITFYDELASAYVLKGGDDVFIDQLCNFYP